MENFRIDRMTEADLDECVDLFIDVFTREPWNDVYDSREQVVRFFRNYMEHPAFAGFLLKDGNGLAALCVGMKKLWLKGMEYEMDQLCVRPDLQGQGVGSCFLDLIEREIRKENMNAILLNTERGFPAEAFYMKNGFCRLEQLVLFSKELADKKEAQDGVC